MNIFGKNVKKYREELNLSYDELSERVSKLGGNLTAEEIEQIENKKRCFWDIEIFLISQALNISIKEITEI